MKNATESSSAELERSITSVETAYMAIQYMTLEIVNKIEFSWGRLDKDGVISGLHGISNAINVLNKYVSDVEEISSRMTHETHVEFQSITNEINAKLANMRSLTALDQGEISGFDIDEALGNSGEFTESERYIAKVIFYNQRLVELRAMIVPLGGLVKTLRR